MQLAVEAQKLFDGVLRDQKTTINYQPDDRDPIPTIFYYIEQNRISLWDTAFYREFAVEKGVNKNNTIDKQYMFKPALHRVLYRYFKYVLFPSKAISRSPPFFVNFLERDSEDFMLTEGIMKSWDSVHWERCGWYLDCPASKAPSFDIVLRDSIQPPSLRTGTPPDTVDTKGGSPKSKTFSKGSRPRGSKRKAAELVEEPIDEDVLVTGCDPLEELADPINSSTPRAAPLKRIQRGVPGQANAFKFVPPAVQAMSSSLAYKSSSASPRVLIINDYFHSMLDYKANHNKFPSTYDEMVGFLSEVHIQHYSPSIRLAFFFS